MLLTLIASLIALAGGILLLRFGAAFTDFPSFAPTLGVMLGLGAGIDYALLIVGRYREQLAAGDTVAHSARVANATAGTSVVAAGAIVVVAIAGLLATGIPFVGRMGVGSAIVVASVAVGAVTVLPTLMGAFARRLRPRNPATVAPSKAFERWAQRIVRRPRTAALAGTLVLSRSPRPCSACGSACPTTATTRAARPPGSPTTASPRASASASTARSCWPRATPATCADQRGRRGTPGVAFVSEPTTSPKATPPR